ncbi:hypothetical protein F2Q70_00037370 [Brassica cretica]|uniref:ATP-dependent RNA helicase n=1 Tax=Brassica cretica TaxID=69181 RepID=A0A8S9JWC2_BRACR|nr:hypothetical protein F2Q70_00037370 [Brassica cretica]
MAGSAPEGTQFDARQFDQKLNEVLEGQDEFFTSYDEVHDSFDVMGLQENLLRGIYAYGFEKPSAIQQRGIVPFCKGLDVIQQAQSGTGKTATFCSGVLQQLDFAIVQCQALVLAPTRELAQQIEKVMRALGDYLGVKVHACVGGTSVREDQRILQAGVHVVVGTPGRVFDMLKRQSLRADNIKMFVLDEADEMLSRGFKDQVCYTYLNHIGSGQTCVGTAGTGSGGRLWLLESTCGAASSRLSSSRLHSGCSVRKHRLSSRSCVSLRVSFVSLFVDTGWRFHSQVNDIRFSEVANVEPVLGSHWPTRCLGGFWSCSDGEIDPFSAVRLTLEVVVQFELSTFHFGMAVSTLLSFGCLALKPTKKNANLARSPITSYFRRRLGDSGIRKVKPTSPGLTSIEENCHR